VAPSSAAAVVITWPLRRNTPETLRTPLGVVARMPTTLWCARSTRWAAPPGWFGWSVARATVTVLDCSPRSPAKARTTTIASAPITPAPTASATSRGRIARPRGERAGLVAPLAKSSLG